MTEPERRTEPPPPLVWTWGLLVLALSLGATAPRLAALGERLGGDWPAPSGSLVVERAGRHLATAGTAAGVGLAAAGGGAVIWTWLGPGSALRVLRPFTLIPLGAIGLSLALLGLLLVRLWFLPVMIAAVALPALIRLTRLRARPHPASSSGFPFPPPPSGDPARPWMWLCVAAVAVWMPWSLAPESQPDAYEYFLAGPERWLLAHGLSVTGAPATQFYPALAEVLFAFPIAAGAEGAAKLMNAGVLLCGACGFLAVVAESAAARWAGLAFVVTSVSGGWFFATGKNEGFGAGYLLLALAAGLAGRSSRSALQLSAVLAGGALSTKLLAAVNLAWVPLVIIPVWWGAGSGSWVRWGLVAALVASPWWLKAWTLTRDPGFPVLSAMLPFVRGDRDARHAEVWRLTTGGTAFRPSFLATCWRSLVTEHAAAAFLLPLVVVSMGRWRTAAVAATGLYAAAHALFLPNQIMRWFYPAIVPALLLAGAAAPGWMAAAPVRRPLLAVLVAASGLAAVSVRHGDPNPFPWLAGCETDAAFSARHLTTFTAAREFLAREPASRAILLAGEVRGYRLGRPVRVASRQASGDPTLGWTLTQAVAGVERLRIRFRQLDVTTVLVNPVVSMTGAGQFTPFVWTERQARLWGEFIGRWWEIAFIPPARDHANGCHWVYRIRRVPLPVAAAPLPHLPGAESEVMRATLLGGADSPAAGLGLLRVALERMPRVIQFENFAGSIARDAGDHAAAYRFTLESVERGWMDDDNWGVHAMSALHIRRFGSAHRALMLVRAGYPGWEDWADRFLAQIRFHLALAELHAGRAAAAERDLTAALAALPPDHGQLWRPAHAGLLHATRSLALRRLRRIGDAEAELARAAALVPELGGAGDPARLAAFLEQTAAALLPSAP